MFNIARTQPLADLTAQYLRDNYLLGLRFVDETGQPYPDSFYEQKIQMAISQFENHTTLTVMPNLITNEIHDYHARDYQNFAYLQLFQYPILISPPAYPQPIVNAQLGGQVLTTFPGPWVRTEQSRGQIHLLPSSGTISQVMLSMSGQYLPALYGASGYVPQLFGITYWAGFDPQNVPRIFVDIIAKLAAIEILSVMGNSIYPPGVTSSSVSADGLSQSRSINVGQDTAPVFSGTLKQYKNDLFGMPSQGVPGLFSQIKDYYRGLTMTVLG